MSTTLGIVDTKKIIAAINDMYGVDYSNYTLTTLRRRFLYVMGCLNILSADILVEQIHRNNIDFDDFVDKLMIDTTELFRDPSLWREVREKLLPEICSSPGSKIWMSGVSSGEELYSLMVVLHEMGLQKDVRVVASCPSNIRIDRIKKGGIFPMKRMELGEANYTRFSGKFEFTKYYTVSDNFAYMDTSLIENVEFNNFNISQDKSDKSYRMIFCRNLMIQYNMPLYERVLQNLMDNLTVGAYLILGNKETINHSEVSKRLYTFDSIEKIYRKRS